MPNRATGVTWDQVLDSDAPSMYGTRTTRGGLSTQAIVETAIAIADVDGLDAVSIRRVAAILDVRPMSLYTHIVNKDELLALMANELIGTLIVEQPLPDDWREALSLVARRQFRMFASHPWLLPLFARRPRHGPNAARYARQLARAVEGLNLPAEDMWTMLSIVNDYILGHAMRVATTGSTRDLVDSLGAEDRAALPEVAALARTEESRLAGNVFEQGFQTVLDGVEHRFVSRER
ncbi:MAG TPA: TetR/AcrR family transcriptional regulator C-terminal domain-containing protein [Conexibacter sp.]|nr:TetR/AcrR family transcriptional regulator C-terminal domain-containing protein [Conexibacter sp.]